MTALETPSPPRAMQLSPGQEWPTVTVADVFDIQQGKALSAAARHADDKHPFLRTVNVLWGQIDLSAVDRMGMTEAERERLQLEPGDLLVCEGGEIGRAAVWHGELPACGYQNHLHRLRARVELDPEFVAFWFRYAFTMTHLYEGVGTRTTIANLSRGRLGALPIPFPPVAEQRRIARVLLAIERGRQAPNSVKGAFDLVKRSVSESAFAGEGAADWPVAPLGDVAPIRQYGLSVRGSASGDLPIVRMTNLRDGRVMFTDLQYVSLPDREAERYKLADGDLLFNRTNSADLVGRVGLVTSPPPSVFASYLIRLRCDCSTMLPAFLCAFLNWGPTQAILRGMATRGVSQANISASTLATLAVPVPPVAEQVAVARWLHAVDAARSASEAVSERASAVFRAAIEELLGVAK